MTMTYSPEKYKVWLVNNNTTFLRSPKVRGCWGYCYATWCGGV